MSLVNVEFGVGVQAMADPAHADAAHAAYTRPGCQGCLRGVDGFGVDGVHELTEHVADRAVRHRQNRDGDDEPDDGVGCWVAERDTASTEKHCKRGESVGARVQAVGHSSRGTDSASHTDAV